MLNTTVYDTSTLLGVFYDEEHMKPPENYWLQFFGEEIQFTTEMIEFSQLTDIRKLAPLVVPTAQGVPIYTQAERRTSVKPAYVKPKDPVSASRMIKRVAGLGEIGYGQPLTPQARYNAIVADIVRQHRYAIERRWEWLAAGAIINAQNILEDERYPRTVVNYLRDPSHSITLTGGNTWGSAGVSILDDLQAWRTRVRTAKFGGATNRLTVGPGAWDIMRKDPEIKELLNTQYRSGANVNLKMAMREGLEVEYVGNIEMLDVWVYSDYYQDPNGTVVPYLGENEVVLTGPNVRGIRCFGAIQDIDAQFQAIPVFPKMWKENDPSASFIMHQSAPLMVPMNPNATLRATVA